MDIDPIHTILIALIVWAVGVAALSFASGLAGRQTSTAGMVVLLLWPVAVVLVLLGALVEVPAALGRGVRDLARAWWLLRTARTPRDDRVGDFVTTGGGTVQIPSQPPTEAINANRHPHPCTSEAALAAAGV